MSRRRAPRFALALAAIVAGCGEPTALVERPEPASPAPASGSRRLAASAPAVATNDSPTSAPIVALVPSDDDAITRELTAGLRQALDEARAAGGPDLELRVATKTAAWGSAVEAAVREAVDQHALAVVAPPDRRTAHALAQLATRVRLPLLSTSPARSVGAAGSTWVVAVVPETDWTGDGAPPAPLWDRTEDRPWFRAGRDAGRTAVAAVRSNGMRRDGFVRAAAEARR